MIDKNIISENQSKISANPMHNLFAYISVYQKTVRTHLLRTIILCDSSITSRIYGNIIDINNKHNLISKPSLLNIFNNQSLTISP